MTIEKAIEILTFLSYDSKNVLTHDDSVGICLGIKALEFITTIRQGSEGNFPPPLPGETKD